MKSNKQDYYDRIKPRIIEMHEAFPNMTYKALACNFRCTPSFIIATINTNIAGKDLYVGNEEKYFNSLKKTTAYTEFFNCGTPGETIGNLALETIDNAPQ